MFNSNQKSPSLAKANETHRKQPKSERLFSPSHEPLEPSPRITSANDERLISRKALSQRWECCTATIANRERLGLRPVRFNPRVVRYRLSDVERIEAAGTTQTAPKGGN